MARILTSPWEQRTLRAEALAARYPFAEEPLRFYQQLINFQTAMYASLRGRVEAEAPSGGEAVLLPRAALQEHRDLLLPIFPEFLDLIRQIGTPALAEAATTLRSVPVDYWMSLLEAYWHQDTDQESGESEAGEIDFFPKAFLQPYASLLARTMGGGNGDAESDWEVAEGIGRCPACGANAQVSVLRPESHGASRSLACSLCSTEWRFKRVRCVRCGEEEFERLFHHSSEEFPHVQVSACDTCRTYIKEVDLSKDVSAVPVVDEIATIPLDVVAVERGYHKLEVNLIGM